MSKRRGTREPTRTKRFMLRAAPTIKGPPRLSPAPIIFCPVRSLAGSNSRLNSSTEGSYQRGTSSLRRGTAGTVIASPGPPQALRRRREVVSPDRPPGGRVDSAAAKGPLGRKSSLGFAGWPVDERRRALPSVPLSANGGVGRSNERLPIDGSDRGKSADVTMTSTGLLALVVVGGRAGRQETVPFSRRDNSFLPRTHRRITAPTSVLSASFEASSS